MTRNLYLLQQEVNELDETFDGVVVSANSTEDARLIHPSGAEWDDQSGEWDGDTFCNRNWCKPWDVKVELIGGTYLKRGVVFASFNDHR